MAARPSKCQDSAMEKQEKAERLAAALRENLRRRKAQARGLAEQPHGDGKGDSDGDEHSD